VQEQNNVARSGKGGALEGIPRRQECSKTEWLQQLKEAKGGECHIVAARPYCSGKMSHAETAKARDTLASKYSWCFTDSVVTYTSKSVKTILKK
jgi:hypothetical protein